MLLFPSVHPNLWINDLLQCVTPMSHYISTIYSVSFFLYRRQVFCLLYPFVGSVVSICFCHKPAHTASSSTPIYGVDVVLFSLCRNSLKESTAVRLFQSHKRIEIDCMPQVGLTKLHKCWPSHSTLTCHARVFVRLRFPFATSSEKINTDVLCV